MQKLQYSPDTVIAEIVHSSGEVHQTRLSDVPVAEKLEKFVEDVKYVTASTSQQSLIVYIRRNGIYPLTAFAVKQPPPPRSRAISPEMAESVKSVTPEPLDIESRKIVNMMCNIKPKEDSCDLLVSNQDGVAVFLVIHVNCSTSMRYR